MITQKRFLSGTLVHTVLVSFRDLVSEAQRGEVIAEYQKLGELCGGEKEGILFWQVGPNLDQRKNWHLVQFSIFRDNEALQRFRSHPAHAKLTEIMRPLSDWVVGDIEIE